MYTIKNTDYGSYKFVNFYHFLDFFMRIGTNNLMLNKITSQYLSHLKINKKREVVNPDIDISLGLNHKPIKIPLTFKKIEEISNQSGLFQYYKRGDNLICLRNDHSFIMGEPKNGKFSIFFSRLDYSMPFFINSIVLTLKFKGLFPLHSVLLSKNNIGFLLAGESGSGKTTLAKNLIKHNFIYLCDDICFLYRLNSRGVGVFVLLPAALKNYYFSRHNFNRCKNAPSDTLVINKNRFSPKIIIFTKLTHRKVGRLIPISNNDAMVRLISLSQLIWMEEKRMVVEHIQLLKDLSNQCLCFELLAGSDAEETSNMLAEALQELINEQSAKNT